MSLKDQKTNYFGILASILILTAGISGPFVVSAEAKFDDDVCKLVYEKYKQLGEQKFHEKYKTKSFLNECIKLYKDPKWYFVGKSKIDKNYEKLASLMQNTAGEKNVDVKILSSVSIGKEKFLVKFRACLDKSAIQQPSFLVKSKLEQFVMLSSKTLQTGKCNDYNVPIKTKQTSNVQITYISDMSKYQNLKSRVL